MLRAARSTAPRAAAGAAGPCGRSNTSVRSGSRSAHSAPCRPAGGLILNLRFADVWRTVLPPRVVLLVPVAYGGLSLKRAESGVERIEVGALTRARRPLRGRLDSRPFAPLVERGDELPRSL